MSMSTTDIVGLLVVCVPMLLLIIYSVRFSKENPGGREKQQEEMIQEIKVIKGSDQTSSFQTTAGSAHGVLKGGRKGGATRRRSGAGLGG